MFIFVYTFFIQLKVNEAGGDAFRKKIEIIVKEKKTIVYLMAQNMTKRRLIVKKTIEIESTGTKK